MEKNVLIYFMATILRQTQCSLFMALRYFFFSKISQNVFTDWRFCFKILSVPNYIRTWTDRQETWYMYAVSFSICVGGYRGIS